MALPSTQRRTAIIQVLEHSLELPLDLFSYRIQNKSSTVFTALIYNGPTVQADKLHYACNACNSSIHRITFHI